MKKNVVFHYGYRVENRKPVKTRTLRAHVQVALLSCLVFAVGYVAVFRGTNSVDSSQALGQSAFQQTEVRVDGDDNKSYELVGVDFPSEGQAAIGTLENGVLQADTVNEKLGPIASMTKVITALAVLEVAPILPGERGDTITLTTQDEQLYWDYVAKAGTVTAVTAGEKMSQYEALQALLLPSSNNMADTLVDYYFYSREEYLDYANQLVKEYGLQYTFIADASGFSPESVSSPSEMIVIAQKALQNPVIAEIVAQPEATISVAGDIPNYNALILEEGVTGIKPGLTDEAGLCLLFSAMTTDADGKEVTVIGVVMGIEDYPTYLNGAKAMINQAKIQIQNQRI